MKITCEKCGQAIQVNEKDESDGIKTPLCPKCAHLTGTTSASKPLTLYWLQAGGCGGDTWSLFNSDAMGRLYMALAINCCGTGDLQKPA